MPIRPLGRGALKSEKQSRIAIPSICCKGSLSLMIPIWEAKKKPGKRGRGAGGKVSVIVAVESRPKGCGHVALSRIEPLRSEEATAFVRQKVKPESKINSDALPAYLECTFHRQEPISAFLRKTREIS